ncbi:MAG: SDR family NAD(P)-dependent oxidoreductase, partial [Caldilineaceae bacterium]|nr:SDR family NAD(P)-dependent oxidoreductase [Caldilineaceae bacterium]
MSVLDRFQLTDRVAIVTGGNRGLGKEMAKALAEAGAQVAIVSRKAEEAQAVAAAIQSETGKTCRGYGCDMTVAEQV